MVTLEIEVVVGERALARLHDTSFIEQWRALHVSCLHGTVFQSSAYCCAWYHAYWPHWQPVIALAHDGAGALVGLWLLAYDGEHRTLAHSGAHQAEYQVWLAQTGMDVAFLDAAWTALKRQLQFQALSFRYLPQPRLVEILKSVSAMRDAVVTRSHKRPILVLQANQLESFLAKKRNRYRFAQLNKLGKLEFRRITDDADFKVAFADLTLYYDFRHAALFQGAPFRDDPHKAEFHRGLFRAGHIAHFTATFLDGRPIAGCWGTVTGTTMHVGMLMHSLFVAKHSPGRFHVLQLSDQLYRDGLRVFDLTPGEDAWKERLASGHDEVAEAVIHRSGSDAQRQRAIRRASSIAKRGLARVGVTPARVGSALRPLRWRIRATTVMQKFGDWLNGDREFRVYRLARNRPSALAPDPRVVRDSLALLLAYEPAEAWQTRGGFLADALARLERGERCYILPVDERVAHYGWMIRNQTSSQVSEVRQELIFEPGSAVLYDFYTPPQYRGRGFYRAAIATMVCEAFACDDIERIYIGVLADNSPSRRVIEAVGFEYQGSLFWSRRFGVERRWRSASIAAPAQSEAKRESETSSSD